MWFVFLGVLLILVIITTYYYTVLYKHYAKAAPYMSDINSLLQKRCDIMYDLVQILKKHAKKEIKVLLEIEKYTDIKVDSLNRKGKMEFHNVMIEAFSHIKNLANKYSDVLDNTDYKKCVFDLEKMNDEFSKLRKKYNDYALEYNNFIDKKVNRFFAKLFNYNKRELFGISDGERNKIRMDI